MSQDRVAFFSRAKDAQLWPLTGYLNLFNVNLLKDDVSFSWYDTVQVRSLPYLLISLA